MMGDVKDNVKGTAMEQRDKLIDHVRRNGIVWGAAIGGAAGLVAELLSQRQAGQKQETPRIVRTERQTGLGHALSATRLPDEGAHYCIADGNDMEAGADFSHAHRAAGRSARGRSGRFAEASDENPLALALIGVGLGMVAARVLPETTAERTELGKVRQRLSKYLTLIGREIEGRLESDAPTPDDTFVPTTEHVRPPDDVAPNADETSSRLH